MISLPVVVDDHSATAIFPSAGSSVFAYSDGYARTTLLKNGAGYWIRSASNTTIQTNGSMLDNDTIDVQARWNMIGSISKPVLVSNIASMTPGLTLSSFYQYDNQTGYTQADTIKPGRGYWVKASKDGKLLLSSAAIGLLATKAIIIPNGEMPPPPPTLSVPNTLPKEFALKQNYPNPFNPSTVIEYQLPVSAHVSLKVYNMIGQEIATLVDGVQDAGYKSARFGIANLSSGVYIYTLTASSAAGGFTDTKKMLLIR
jgi:hypothetical protein